jgi:hypothetical protein
MSNTDLIVEVTEGAVFEVPYPFVRYEYEDHDGSKRPSWKPGIDREQCYDHYREVADGVGKQVLQIICVHKPGRFPTRVFFTRKWIDPDGNTFGKSKLRIKTIGNFKQLTKGYGYNLRSWGGMEYEIRKEAV